MTAYPQNPWNARTRLGEGPLWSSEYRCLLFVDILGSRLLSYAPDSGETRSWPLEEACCWLAPHADGARVTRFLAGGRRDQEIRLPASRVTCCTFGGDDLATLYITTAAEGCDAQSQAGALFSVRPGVQGLAPCVYRP